MTILAELAAAARPLTLSQLTRRTGFAKTTTHRLLAELLADGLVRRDETRYRLNSGVSWLAAPVDESICRLRWLRPALLPHLLDIFEKTRLTVNLAVLHGDEIIYVERIYGHNRVRSRSDGSDRALAHLTAGGKLLLAYLPHAPGRYSEPAVRPDPTRNTATERDLGVELSGIRREGVAFSFGDLTPGVHCVAAPVRDRTGRPIAAISLAGMAREFDPVRFVPMLRRTAHAMTLAAHGPVRQKTRRNRRSAL